MERVDARGGRRFAGIRAPIGDHIRRSGVARSAQEHRLGVSSVAVPLLDHSGLVAALGLLAPLTSARLGNSLAPLRAAAAAITQGFSAAAAQRT